MSSVFRVKLAEVVGNWIAIEDCCPGDGLSIYGDANDPRYWLVRDATGRDLGVLPRRGKLMEAVLDGGKLLAAEVQSTSAPTEAKPYFGLTVNVSVAEKGTAFSAGLAALRATAPEPPRTYKVGIVGESNYQAAIFRTRIGETARVVHEPGNPHGVKALAVENASGLTLGYIGRDHWLQRAIHEEGKGCSATIAAIEAGGGGALGVVLEVALAAGPIASRHYDVPLPDQKRGEGRQRGFLSRLLGLGR